MTGCAGPRPTRDDRRRCRTRSPSSSTRPSPRCPTRCGSWPARSRSPTREARERTGRAAAALADLGAGRGDLVLATMRSTPDYLFTWLAVGLRRLDPRHREPAQRPGRAGRARRPGAPAARGHRPRPRRRDGGGAGAGAPARWWTSRGCSTRRRAADGTGPGAARRRGRADPDLGHDRPLEARDADPPGLRDGGRGLPVVDGARPGRPADDVAAALPHQRARLLDARLGRGAGEPGAACRPSRRARSSTPRGGTGRPSSTRSGRCSRSSCASPNGPTTPTIRCGCATPARRRRSSASSRSRPASACASCAATPCPRRRTARSGRAAPARTARSAASASTRRSGS